MNIQKALDQYAEHQKVTIKEKTRASYRRLMERFLAQFSDREGEIAFMPEHIATRMPEYISSMKLAPKD